MLLRAGVFVIIGMLLCVCCALAETAVSFPRPGQVISDDANVRVYSTTSAEIITKLTAGSIVTLVKENFEWYAIRLPASVPCYIYARFITRLNETNGIINSENVNIRLRADKKSAILGKLDQGTSVIIKRTEAEWYTIDAPAQAIGWIHKSLIRPTILTEVPAASAPSISPIAPAATAQNTLASTNAGSSVEITGILRERGRTFGLFKKNISHSITTDDETTYLVKGDKTSLDLHSNYRVTIKGAITPESSSSRQPVIDAETITRVK